MLFLIYWELNEGMSLEQRMGIAQKLTESGFPPEGVEVVRWDTTPDGWGVTILEAESAADVFRALNMWRAAGTGFFKHTKTAPALEVSESMPLLADVVKSGSSG